MITEDYVSFETAKLMHDKGFNLAEFHGQWAIDYDNVPRTDEEDLEGKIIVAEWQYPLITHQMAMKWLREVHHLQICITSYSYAWKEYIHGWQFVIKKLIFTEGIGWNWDDGFDAIVDRTMSDDTTHETYEETCESAIKHCLENLI